MTQATIEIVYATPANIVQMHYVFAEPKTVEAILLESGFLEQNRLDLAQHEVGIYGKIVALTTEVKSGDRIEIYRPLINDPKTIRRKRASK